MSDHEIINRAIGALNNNLHSDIAMLDYCEGLPYLSIMGKKFKCVVDPHITSSILDWKERQSDKGTRILFITSNITPKMLDLCKRSDINVLDCAGNFNIKYQMGNGNVVLWLANKGEKPIADIKFRPAKFFTDKGLRVIFYLLLDKKNITNSYREIVDATGVSIGTVKNIIDGLISLQFVHIENGRRFLKNTDRLLSLWASNFEVTLKPKLFLTRFVFRNEEKRKDWEHMKLPDGMLWGGESAASITDGYLTPGEFTIYTEIPSAILMKTGAVVPDPNGEIAIYRKFWTANDSKTVPAILTYADLIATSNGRCIEAAQKIKDNELKYLF